MDAGNSGTGVRNVILDVRSDSVRVLMESGCSGWICVYRKFSLEVESWNLSSLK